PAEPERGFVQCSGLTPSLQQCGRDARVPDCRVVRRGKRRKRHGTVTIWSTRRSRLDPRHVGKRRAKMANPFVHVELATTDVGKAKPFYQSLFDWQLEDMDMGGGMI